MSLLQVTPGPGFTGTLSFVCAGQLFGAVCTVPASVTISGGAVTPFTISVSTLARRRDAAGAPSVSAFAAARSVAALGGGQCVGDATGQSRAR
jgi:hypothetical protein